ncbi:MAG: DEAD/DEAH box helicase family protein [Acidobacteria bacterium]|nr:DEAD/DEAH box helicase family protein [Acidobacteriota bacterium]
MAWELKLYQERCLAVLGQYLVRAAEVGAKKAFDEREELLVKYREIPQLPGLPYICLRVPTGGGKTLLAAHTVGISCRTYLRADRCVVLWLAPTNAIVDQTLKALRERTHPYRQALDSAFGGAVQVMSLPEALYLTRATLDSDTVVIVSTLAAMRVEDTEGRKVYEGSGVLQHHFSGLAEAQITRLERTDGTITYSLASVLRLRCPLVIMDEAHNARTKLSFDALRRFGPSCIIEYTATPDQETNPSNVLVSVSAAELKAEQMVKLPIRLVSRKEWREAVGEGVTKQKQLENLAREEEKITSEYIRPIVLFQAQPRREGQETITVEVLRKCLMEDFNIPAEEIAEGTGQKWELPENISARDCPVRYVLTVAALREGWDCPFAYVLCSVSNLSSRGAVEQILGRVLRLPRVQAKQHEDLNYAYAYATSERFLEAAESLKDALVESGFERFEAKAYIEPGRSLFEGEVAGPLFTESVTESEYVSEPPPLDALPESLRGKVKVEPPTQHRPTAKVTYTGPAMSLEEESILKAVLKAEEDRKSIERLARKTRGLPAYPAAMGVKFEIPALAVRVGGQLEIFEDQFRDAVWNLAECDAKLSEEEFSLTGPTGQAALVDVDEEGKTFIRHVQEVWQQLSFHDIRGPKTESELADWLDRAIDHPDITQTQSSLFLRRMVDHLVTSRGIPLPNLVAARFRLRDAAKRKIDQYRRQAMYDAYQRMLLPEAATPLEVSPEICFQYPNDNYPAPRYYEGPIKFEKHFYELPGEMNGEEGACAQLIDSQLQVQYWVRNLDQRADCSFWLQTSTDKFYPDFVAKLADGRYLVVEYKGADRMDTPDTREKKTIGELWEARSHRRCVFRLVGRSNMEQVLIQALK